MSFFGKSFTAALAQTFEAVGNIVAPLPDDEDEAYSQPNQDHNFNDNNDNINSSGLLERDEPHEAPRYPIDKDLSHCNSRAAWPGSTSPEGQYHAGRNNSTMPSYHQHDQSLIYGTNDHGHPLESPVSHLSEVDLDDDNKSLRELNTRGRLFSNDDSMSVQSENVLDGYHEIDLHEFSQSAPGLGHDRTFSDTSSISIDLPQDSSPKFEHNFSLKNEGMINLPRPFMNGSINKQENVLKPDANNQSQVKVDQMTFAYRQSDSKLHEEYAVSAKPAIIHDISLKQGSPIKDQINSYESSIKDQLLEHSNEPKLHSPEILTQSNIHLNAEQLPAELNAEKQRQDLEMVIQSKNEEIMRLHQTIESTAKINHIQKNEIEELRYFKISSLSNIEAMSKRIEQLENDVNTLTNNINLERDKNQHLSKESTGLLSRNEALQLRINILEKENSQLTQLLETESMNNQRLKQQSALDANAIQSQLHSKEQRIAELSQELSNAKQTAEYEALVLDKLRYDVQQLQEKLKIAEEDTEKHKRSEEKLIIELNDTMKRLNDIDSMQANHKESTNNELWAAEKATISELQESLDKCKQIIKTTEIEKETLTHQVLDHLATVESLRVKLKEAHGRAQQAQQTNATHQSMVDDGKDAEILGLLTQIKLLESQLANSSATIHAASKSFDVSIVSEVLKKLMLSIEESSKLIHDLSISYPRIQVKEIGENVEEVVQKVFEYTAIFIDNSCNQIGKLQDEIKNKEVSQNNLQEQVKMLRKELDQSKQELETNKSFLNQKTESHVDSSLIAVKESLIDEQKQAIEALENELKDLHSKHQKLQQEYHQLSSSSSHYAQEHEKARSIVQNDLLVSQAEVIQANELIHSLKAKLHKSENENKQYQTVIAQLRSARKVNNQDIDSIIAERDELRRKVETHINETQRISRLLAQATEDVNKLQNYEKDHHQMQDSLKSLEMELTSEQQEKLHYQRIAFDKEMALDVLKTDNLILKKDLQQRELELSNLYSTITHFDKEKDIHQKKLQEEYEKQIEIYRKRMDEDVESIESTWKSKYHEQEQKLKEYEIKLQDESLLRRKAEIDFNNDRKRMQQTLHDAVDQLRNSQNDVVDRALVANLLVSYFQRKRSLDVLDLIGRVLNFDEDQKVAVGLRPPPINIVSSLYKTLIGPPPKPVEVDGNNLAELWVNFLLVETEQDLKNKKKQHSPRATHIAGDHVSSEGDDKKEKIEKI